MSLGYADSSLVPLPARLDQRDPGKRQSPKADRLRPRRVPVDLPSGGEEEAVLVPLRPHPRRNASMVDEERWDPGNYDPVRLFAEALIENERAARPRLSAPKLAKVLRGLGLKVSSKQVRTMKLEIKARHEVATARAKQRAREHTHHPVPWQVLRHDA